MKKFLLAGLLATGAIFGASAETKVTVTPIGERPAKEEVTTSDVLSMACVIANENFDAMTAGDIAAPDYDNQLASYYDNPNIDPALTHGDQWQGHKVYSAGGAIAMRTFNPSDQAYIETPRGDYSGTVTLSFRAKYLHVEWEQEDGSIVSWGSSVMFVAMVNDSDRRFQMSESANNIAQINVYRDMGWVDVRVEFDNYSAYNDAALTIFTGSGVVIDDIKVTSSIDKFIANPVVTSLTDVTETSFTVNFEPVRHSSNYYGYLFSLDGYDEDGLPKYQYTFPEDMLDELKAAGMTIEDYVASMSGKYEPYLNSFMTERRGQTSLTFSNLDPNKEYYYAVASHHLKSFSDYKKAIKPVNVLPTPCVNEASNIKENEFAANWSPVTKADAYKVNLYGVNQVAEDEENFIIFDEDFENVTAYTEATDIKTPEWVGEENDIKIDDLVSTPGWDSSEYEWPVVEGKLGLKWKGAWIATPDLYVANSDQIGISIKAEFPTGAESFIIKFGDKRYTVPVANGSTFEDEVYIPTDGLEKAPLQIACADDYAMFIDYLTVSQSLKKGDLTYVWLGSEIEKAPEVSHLFSAMDTEKYDLYGYSVIALKGEGRSQISSVESNRAIVDLKNENSFIVAIDQIEATDSEVVETGRYTIDGIRINAPQKGLNIVRYSDGTVKKVMVK